MERKAILLFLTLLAACAGLHAQQVWTDHNRLLPDKLRGIPTGILIVHDPTPVYPEPNTDTAEYPGKYIWKHRSTVSSLRDDLTVTEVGSYIWIGDKGWVPNIRLDNAGFALRFNCPGGLLEKGRSYTFLKNWRYGDVIYAGDALWFVLAKDKQGKTYKGTAIVETEGKLKTHNMKTSLLLIAALLWQTATLKTNDLDGLLGKHWAGTLTYLDYGTNQLTPIETELTVKAKSPGVYQWMTAYPKEADHNSKNELVISADGKLLDGETVKERTLSDGTLKIVTETSGKDNNKPALYRFTYLIGKSTFSRKKEVCYVGQTVWFTRNELKLEAK